MMRSHFLYCSTAPLAWTPADAHGLSGVNGGEGGRLGRALVVATIIAIGVDDSEDALLTDQASVVGVDDIMRVVSNDLDLVSLLAIKPMPLCNVQGCHNDMTQYG